jgi:hypothetical protein
MTEVTPLQLLLQLLLLLLLLKSHTARMVCS